MKLHMNLTWYYASFIWFKPVQCWQLSAYFLLIFALFVLLPWLIWLDRQCNGKRKWTKGHMWHPSFYYCYKPGHMLYSVVFSNFYACNNIVCVSFDWKDIFRFYKSMYIVNPKLIRECIVQGMCIRSSWLFCDSFVSSICISSLTCRISLCSVHQNVFLCTQWRFCYTRVHRFILKCEFNDKCNS